jgi:hypothetical protein
LPSCAGEAIVDLRSKDQTQTQTDNSTAISSTNNTQPMISTTPINIGNFTAIPTSTWGELAMKGKNYFILCAGCHGKEGRVGSNVPSIIGATLKLGSALRLFDYISINIPQDSPGLLSKSTYLQILAFILIESDFVQSKDRFDLNDLADGNYLSVGKR